LTLAMRSSAGCFALLGGGAISSAVVSLVANDPVLRVGAIVRRRPANGDSAIPVVRDVRALDASIPLVVEAAGAEAVREHGAAILASGRDLALLSTSALADAKLQQQLVDAARGAGRRLLVLSGAIGGIDMLCAARVGGLDRVRYTGRKPPLAWKGTPAERMTNLDGIDAVTTIFQGSARDAVTRYPQNANVAATLALAGIGFDRTEVVLVADPSLVRNRHAYEASGSAATIRFECESLPLASNPKTSAATVHGIIAFLRAGSGSFDLQEQTWPTSTRSTG
jgi:aspartate dehydrogenase